MPIPVELPALPALVPGEVAHARHVGPAHRFRYRVYQWLVDTEELPALSGWCRWFSQFRSADHIGSPNRSIAENIKSFCLTNGIDAHNHRVIMLANARVLGYTFDPLSVFWVIAPDGTLTCLVAEVHNTYGERHAYLISDPQPAAQLVDKQFYVSPFFDVSGKYRLSFRLTPEQLVTSITLLREGKTAYTASFVGSPCPFTTQRLAWLVLSRPLMTWRVTALIRIHGIWLWLRRIPVHKRPRHHPQEGTQ